MTIMTSQDTQLNNCNLHPCVAPAPGVGGIGDRGGIAGVGVIGGMRGRSGLAYKSCGGVSAVTERYKNDNQISHTCEREIRATFATARVTLDTHIHVSQGTTAASSSPRTLLSTTSTTHCPPTNISCTSLVSVCDCHSHRRTAHHRITHTTRRATYILASSLHPE